MEQDGLYLVCSFMAVSTFWAIAWVAHNDYSKAGFKLLPGGGAPTRMTALQAIAYAVMMIPVGVLPYYFGLTGIVSFGL